MSVDYTNGSKTHYVTENDTMYSDDTAVSNTWIIKDGTTENRISDGNAFQIKPQTAISSDAYIIGNLATTSVSIQDYSNVTLNVDLHSGSAYKYNKETGNFDIVENAYLDGDTQKIYTDNTKTTELIGYQYAEWDSYAGNDGLIANTPGDTLYIKNTGTNGYQIYFDVFSTEEEPMEIWAGLTSIDLHIYSKDAGSTNGVTIENYFLNGHYTDNYGQIEQIRIGNKLLDLSAVETVKNNIQTWLDSKGYWGTQQVMDFGDDKQAIKDELLALYVFGETNIPSQDVTGEYNVNIITDNLTVTGDNTLNFNAGCGNKTITLGDNEFSTILNFISDTENGYVSTYAIDENIETGAITITRKTGTITMFGLTTLYTDTLTITDFIANGQGKVTFKGFVYNATEETNDLLENVTGFSNKNTDIYLNPVTATAGEEFTGTWLSEYIKGTSSADTINGGAGKDKIESGAGNDIINGGAGNDSLVGGEGNDLIYGGDGKDSLYGDASSDPKPSKSGDDTIIGGTPNGEEITYNADGSIATGITWNTENTTITTGYGNDKVYAGAGNDNIKFQMQTETTKEIHGGAGNDVIQGFGTSNYGSGTANIWGDGGSDTFTISDMEGSYILKDACSDDVLVHVANDHEQENNADSNTFGAYQFAKDGNNLVITLDSYRNNGNATHQTITLENHFVKLANGTQLDTFSIGGVDYSLLESATVNVTVADGETYTATGYKENITLTGDNAHTISIQNNSGADTISGAKLGDVIRLEWVVDDDNAPTAEMVGDDLVFTFDNTNSLFVQNFNYADATNNIDTIEVSDGNGGYEQISILDSIKFEKTITGSYDKTTPYHESIIVNTTNPITVTGLDDEDELTVADNSVEFTRTNDGGLVINNQITVSDFFTNNKDLDINYGTDSHISTAAGTINVSLTDGFAYTATRFTEAISGSGSVTGLGANDKLITTGTPVYSRTDNGNLFVDDIEVTDFNWDGAHNINVNDGTTANMTVNVTVTDEATYTTTKYNENITINGDATFNVTKDTSVDTIVLTEGSKININMNGLAYGFATLSEDGTLSLTDKKTNPKWGKLIIQNYLQYGEGAVTFSNGDITDVALEDIMYSSMRTTSPLGDDYDIFRVQTSANTVTEGVPYTGTFLSDWVNGTAAGDTVNGGAGRDDIDGAAGNDEINGGAGNDYLVGGEGDDTINGGADDDYIYGGTGNDSLTGGEGNDRFVFKASDGTNTITDAEAGDIIEFTVTNFADLSFNRTASSNDLTVTNDSTNVVVTDFFNGHNIDDITAKDGNKSILNNSTINVTVADGETYTVTGYKENITLTGDNAHTINIQSGSGKDTIIDSKQGDVINFADKAYSALSLKRGAGWDLEITYSETDKVVIEDFFIDNTADRIDDLITLDNGVATAHKISDLAVFDIILDEISGPFDKDAEGYTGYKVNIYLDEDNNAGVVSNIKEGDTINLNDVFANITFEKSETSLLIKNGDKTLTINNYFNADGSVAANVINTFYTNNAETPFTLEWHTSNATGEEAMYVVVEGTEANENIEAIAGIQNWINGGEGDDTITGANAGDMLAGNTGANEINPVAGGEAYGENGNDIVNAAGGNFIGVNGGNDTINLAGTGNNTIWVYNDTPDAADATFNMTITGATATDTLKFNKGTIDGYSLADLSFTKSENDLVITIANNKGTVTVKDYFATAEASRIKNFITLEGETKLTSTLEWHTSNVTGEDAMYRVVEGTEANENIEAIAGIQNWINGGEGDDTITGANAGDMLAGNSGNNEIIAPNGAEVYGENGNDTVTAAGGNFIWTHGGDDDIALNNGNNTVTFSKEVFGNDTIEGSTATDTLKFTISGEGYKLTDLTFAQSGNDLVIGAGNDGTITVKDYIAQAEADRIKTLVTEGEISTLKWLTNGEEYAATEAKEVISGTGTVTGMSDNDTLVFTGEITNRKVGNDLVITDGTSTVTVTDYFNGNNKGQIISNGETSSLINNTDDDASLRIIGVDSKGNAQGSALAETLAGNTKNNTIKGGGGNDLIYGFAGKNKIYTESKAGDKATVYSGTGADTLYAGSGTDTYYFGHGHGSDTLIANATAEKTILMFEDGDKLTFKESGKNLVITQREEVAPGSNVYATETITIKDFVKNGYRNIYLSNLNNDDVVNLRDYLTDINNNQIFTVGNSKAKKKQTVSGSFLNEKLVGGTKADKLTAGAGYDTLIGGKGNDKLYGNASGPKTFQFAKKDGSDTIYNAKAADTIKFSNVLNGSNMKYAKKGNNLVITYNSYKKGKKTITDKITLANYFKKSKATAIKNIEFANGEVINLQDKVFTFSGKGKISGTVYNDKITGSKKNDTYTLTQGGKDTVIDSAGNDKYNTNVSGKLTITDKAGKDIYNVKGAGDVKITDNKGNDTYNVTLNNGAYHEINDKAGKDTLVLKNVTKADTLLGFDVQVVVSNNAAGSERAYTYNSKNLYIMDKNGTGLLEIDNFYKTNGKTTAGAGKIETIKDKNGASLSFKASQINEIMANVSAWLGDHTDYNSASEVFKKGNEADIQSLITAYADTYNHI